MSPNPIVVLTVVLAACSPRLTPAQEVPAHWRSYRVELIDAAGHALPTFDHRGRTYVLGAIGDRYLLRFRNDSDRRVEVVASVDGRDVVDGRPAAFDRRGYLVEPHGELTIDGYRLSREAVAAFRFSPVARSYAARMGDARDVGVVGVAVFPERAPVATPLPRPSPRASDLGRAGEERAGQKSGEAAAPAAASGAPAPAESRSAQVAPPRTKERPGLGTEFGEEHESRVVEVSFERESSRPEAILTLRYDDRPGLLALGIDVDGDRRARRDEAWRRQTASPFRSEWAEPPPGWRAGGR